MTSAEVADRDHSPVAEDDGWTCDVCGLPVEVGAVRHLEAPE